jgi:outer membrane protein assembly factor BamD (BamD/ComL family)
MQQIARARKLVTSDPEEALELLETSAERYPRGYFVEERRALTVFALVALGKRTRAKNLAETFLRDYPKGLFSDDVRRAMAQEKPSTNKSSKP